MDGYTESPEAAHVVMSAPFTSSLLVQTLGALEKRLTFQHPIQNYEQLVGNRHNRTLLASSPLLEPNGEHGALFADRGQRARRFRGSLQTIAMMRCFCYHPALPPPLLS